MNEYYVGAGIPLVSGVVYIPLDCLYKAYKSTGEHKYFPTLVQAEDWLEGRNDAQDN